MKEKKDRKDKFVIARVPEAMFVQFRKKAEQGGQKVSEKIRELIDKYLK